jgi:hypothetical protein
MVCKISGFPETVRPETKKVKMSRYIQFADILLIEATSVVKITSTQ